MEMTYALTRNKRSSKWQFRKRYPSDIARILPGEFVKSTGEEDKKAAQARVPMIAAEYERRIAEARAKLAEALPVTLGKPQILAMAAQFYAEGLDAYTLKHAVGPEEHRKAVQSLRERLEYAEGAGRRKDFGVVRFAVNRRVEAAGLDLHEDSPEIAELLEQHMRAYIDAHRHCIAVLEGEGDLTPSPWSEAAAVAEGGTPERTVGALLDAYEADKGAGWAIATKRAFEPVGRVLRDVFGARDVKSVTRDDARDLRKLLEGLPANLGRRKELEGMTIPQAVRKGKELGLPAILPKTINSKYLVTIAAVFNWARKEQWITSTPFESLMVHDPAAPEDKRDPFTPDQMNRLFRSGPWQAPWGNDERKAGAFWVPFITAFHGLRNAEAAGLRVEDVGEEDGVPVLHVRPYDERGLKTKDARGTLPVHPELVRLGFMGFVKERQESGDALLFPDGVATKGREVGANLGAWFSRHVQRLKLEGRKLGMHSFRHNFEDALRRAELPDRTSLALARRSEAGSSKVYGSGISARQKAEALAKVAYPNLDLSHLHIA